MQRLRAAKDKSEFDQFMDDRAQKPTHGATATDASPERSDPTGVRAILLKLFWCSNFPILSKMLLITPT